MKRVKEKERVSNKITTNKSLDITNIKIFKYTILILTLNSSEKNQKKSIKLVFLDENKNVTILDDKKSIDMVINKEKTTIIC